MSLSKAIIEDDLERAEELLKSGQYSRAEGPIVRAVSVEMCELYARFRPVPEWLVGSFMNLPVWPSDAVIEWACANGSKVPIDGMTTFVGCHRMPNYRLMRLLLENGTMINYSNYCHGSSLHMAETVEMVDQLLRLGANPYNQSIFSEYSLRMDAVKYHVVKGKWKIVKLFLEAGYDSDVNHPKFYNIKNGVVFRGLQKDLLKMSFWAALWPSRMNGLMLLFPGWYTDLVWGLSKLPRHLVKEIMGMSFYPRVGL